MKSELQQMREVASGIVGGKAQQVGSYRARSA